MKKVLHDFIDLVFPNCCPGCDQPLVSGEERRFFFSCRADQSASRHKSFQRTQQNNTFAEKVNKLRVGDPLDPNVDIGPVVEEKEAVRIEELGYDRDWMGEKLVNADQILELRVQDVVLPMNCAESLLAATQYLDELLEKLYGLPPFYNCKNISDLIGHLGMGIAPHTSGSIVCRIIGFAAVKGHYGHPFFHAAKRRNCDGDIDAFLLLLDGLLNFSKSFLPSTRGGLMDAPLILTMKINPSEIDKEALNVETVTQYPVSFYEATQNFPPAKEAVKAGVEIVENRLGSPAELSGFGFTHDSEDCAGGR